MFKVLISDPVSEFGIQSLLDADDVEVVQKTDLNEEELLNIIADFDGLLVRSQTKVTPAVFQAADQLKIVGRAGVGVDNIDLDAATKKGVVVVNAPDGNTISTAEHAFAMMMSMARKTPQAYKSTTDGNWDRKAFRGVELNNKVLGVIGMGRIGTEVARRAKAFNMKIVAFDPFLTEDRAKKLGVESGSVDDVIKQADFITVHTPLTKDTKHIISYEQFEKMKPGVRLINCARGGIIDEKALYDAIIDKKVAGAALDVFEVEPPVENPLLELPEVVVTPHLGASTAEAQENVAVDVSEEMLHVLRNQPFKNAVNLPPVRTEVMHKLEPYFLLVEKLGGMVSQLAVGAPEEIQMTYSGELGEVDTTPLTRTMLKGVLAHHLGSEVNYVSALHLAKQHDLSYTVHKSPQHRGFTNLITVSVKTDKEECSVAGTSLNGYGPRIVKIDGYSIDISPQDHLLLIQHSDRPGMIGHVGSILGENEVNIGTMQVGRKDVGGHAIMMLSIDKAVSEDALQKLKQVSDIVDVRDIEL